MGYYIRSLQWKKKRPAWKVQFVSYKKKDQRSFKAKMPKRTWDISKERWRSLGFHISMTLDESRARARQLNSQLLLKQQEETIRKIQIQEQEFRNRYEAVLPDEFVREFEERFVRPRGLIFISHKDHRQRLARRYVVWRAVQRMVTTLSLEPTDWFYHTTDFYDYFYQQQYSLGYIQGILSLANLWGHFLSRKLCRPFLFVPMPKGYERQRLIDAFYEKDRSRRPSLPLNPDRLSSIARKINRANFNWLYLSVWFGLRPQEIDNLHNHQMWRLEQLPTGRQVLWVFQTKIVALPPEDRWKPIPILLDKQHFALKILKDGHFKRPLSKTVKKYFGKGYDLYAGRKGFVDLMLSKGHSLDNISVWMGHSTLNRTWRSYKQKGCFHL